jgi:hypothetical protein
VATKRKTSSNRIPPFVPLTWKMLNHLAYKKLPASAAKALPYFIGKIQYIRFHDPERYTSVFPFPFSEGVRLGFSRATFSKVIRDLVAYGWIDPVQKGGLNGFGLGRNRFRLSTRWEQYGTQWFEPVDWKGYVQGKV